MTTAILGTGSYLPESVLTSAELGTRLGVGEQWILDKTRIAERRVAAPGEATSDMAAHAARRALEGAGLEADEIDLLIVATSTPDQPMPATACTVQRKIGATRAAAFDVDAVCSGFLYALVTAHGVLTADPEARNALVIGADTYSSVLDYTDRRTAVLFGDGAGAVVLSKTDGHGIMATTLGSDGTLDHLVRIPGGGSRRPASAETLAAGEHYFAMRGREVRDLAARVLPDVIARVLKSTGLEPAGVDLIVPHQANGVMLQELADTLALRPGQLHLTVSRYGNTGAASVPVTLDDAVRSGRISRDDIVVLVAFGGGMTWGGAALRWTGRA
ncbi:beta-ketoacyl-ACP synthase III [Amycolatopsis sp.]|uniref:3-oxoacyl-ACP synthase III family protein n=1 Tax=Amycolatopsis sp. TaxID=37632 RepID=UPI002B922170|nr:beta-ketoacyl-ACP synthase III [Amycolatopsis sp.]HVV10531.1 beta-ketoacyl-ACP synthase III [Amycolatopsis sp.]